MSKDRMKTIVVAPHPDDEVLGVGGTLLRRKAEGHELAWVIVTGMSEDAGWGADAIARRENEIRSVAEYFGFSEVFSLGFPPAGLDRVPMGELIGALSNVFKSFAPEEVFIPHPADAHSDHRITFDAVTSCTKWFRYASVRRVLAYETPSESDFGLGPEPAFRPTVFSEITPYLDSKIEVMRIYSSEMGEFPFPRSDETIRSLARLRGAASGFHAAEAFELLRERS